MAKKAKWILSIVLSISLLHGLVPVAAATGTDVLADLEQGENPRVIYDSDARIKELKPVEAVDLIKSTIKAADEKGKITINPEAVESIPQLSDQAESAYSARDVIAGRVSDYLISTDDFKLYALEIQPGIFLQAQLTQPGKAGLDYDLYILDSEGYILESSEYITKLNGVDGTLPESVGFYTNAADLATYYLYVGSKQGGSAEEAFTLEYSVSNVYDDFEIDDNAKQALGFKFDITGSYIEKRNLSSPIDNDWYVLNIPSEKAYDKLELTISTASANTCGIEVYKNVSQTGIQLVKQSLYGNSLSVSTGTYYVRVYNIKTMEQYDENDIQNYKFQVVPNLRPDTIVITDLNGTEGLNKVVNYGWPYGTRFRTGTGVVTVSGYVTVIDSNTGELWGIPSTRVNAEYYNKYWEANHTPDYAHVTNFEYTDGMGRFNVAINLPPAIGANIYDNDISYHYFDDCEIKVQVNNYKNIKDSKDIFHVLYSVVT